MKKLWFRLVEWYYKRNNTLESLMCPSCNRVYFINGAVPSSAGNATIVCATHGCGQQMELRPHEKYGWRKPLIEKRARA